MVNPINGWTKEEFYYKTGDNPYYINWSQIRHMRIKYSYIGIYANQQFMIVFLPSLGEL